MLLVIGDNRGAIVEVSKIQAGSTLLANFEFMRLLGQLGTRRIPKRTGSFYLGRHLAALLHDPERDLGDDLGRLIGDRLTFGLVCVEDVWTRPAFDYSRKDPR